MDSKDVLIDTYGRIQRILEMSLKELTAEQLLYRPDAQSNTIAWCAWHLTRVQDHHLSDLAHIEQAWMADGWHAKFDKPADPGDTGQGYSPDQVAAIKPSSSQLLVDYHNAVLARSTKYIQGLRPADLDVVLNEPRWNPMPTVGVRLVSVAADNLQHAGQLAYLRGLVEGKRWFPA
ncbi:MAG TPA: DUF664 domain-containing protein [Chloroflexota bacterium]|nr:DUF664 domain-containing protein [Chloroflexota bacterium]